MMSIVRSSVIPDISRSSGEFSSDPRATRTRQVILDAATRLPSNRADAISVSDIVREAGISRSSFYAHFASLDDLAGALLRQEFAAIVSPIASPIGSTTADERPEADATNAFRDSYRRLVDHFSRGDSIYSSALGLPLSRRVYDEVVSAYADQVRAAFEGQSEGAPGIRSRMAAAYVAGGTITLLGAWTAGELDISADELVDELVSLLPPWLS